MTYVYLDNNIGIDGRHALVELQMQNTTPTELRY